MLTGKIFRNYQFTGKGPRSSSVVGGVLGEGEEAAEVPLEVGVVVLMVAVGREMVDSGRDKDGAVGLC